MVEPKGELSLIGLSGEYPDRSYNGRKGIGQYRRGLSAHPVVGKSGTRLDYDSMRFGETQGDSERFGEHRENTLISEEGTKSRFVIESSHNIKE
jgi:hypothetical protein